VKLALDHHYATAIAVEVRRRGHDVTAAVERRWQAEDDESLLLLCREDGRALLTNNVAEFVAIVAHWLATGRAHPGLVFTSDVSMPRGKRTVGLYVSALDGLMAAEPDGLTDQIRCLRPPMR
jgi:hypothetical protein